MAVAPYVGVHVYGLKRKWKPLVKTFYIIHLRIPFMSFLKLPDAILVMLALSSPE